MAGRARQLQHQQFNRTLTLRYIVDESCSGSDRGSSSFLVDMVCSVPRSTFVCGPPLSGVGNDRLPSEGTRPWRRIFLGKLWDANMSRPISKVFLVPPYYRRWVVVAIPNQGFRERTYFLPPRMTPRHPFFRMSTSDSCGPGLRRFWLAPVHSGGEDQNTRYFLRAVGETGLCSDQTNSAGR